MCPSHTVHTRLLLPKACTMLTMGPWTHAHPSCWRTALCLTRAFASPSELRRAAPHCTPAPFGTPAAAAPLCTAAPLDTLLCTAHLSTRHLSARHLSCTSRCTSPHRCAALHISACALQLAVPGVAPAVQSAGSTHSPNRQVTSFVIECLPERPLLCSAAQAGCGCSTAGWRSSVSAREDVRSG